MSGRLSPPRRLETVVCALYTHASCAVSDPSLALVVVYDYHPNAETLFDLHLKPRPPTFQNGTLQSKNGLLVSEQTLWSYIIQLASAIQAVHDAGLAVRFMDPTKILVTSKNRYEATAPPSLKLLSIFPQGPNQLMWFDRHSHIRGSSIARHQFVTARRPRLLWETRLRTLLWAGERNCEPTESATDDRQALLARREERSGVPR